MRLERGLGISIFIVLPHDKKNTFIYIHREKPASNFWIACFVLGGISFYALV